MHRDSYKVRELVCISLISSRLNNVFISFSFYILNSQKNFLQSFCCFSLMTCDVECWALQTLFRRTGMEEARGRKDHWGWYLIKLISHLWHGREFLNPISLVLGQGKGSVTGSLASVNRSFSLRFIRRTYFLLLTWKHAKKWIWFWISYHTPDICSSAYFCFR